MSTTEQIETAPAQQPQKKGFKQTEVGWIPEDWEVRTLGEVGEVRMCKRIFNHQTKETGEIPFFKIGTFGKAPDAFIDEKLFNEYVRKYSYPKVGDILISASGTIGRTVVFDGRPAYFQDSNIIWIDNYEKLVLNKYLYHIYQVTKYGTEGGTIQRLYNDIIKPTKFICPPKAEQTAIATALSDMDVLIEAQEQLIAKKRAIKQGAMQELLQPKEGWEVKRLGDIVTIAKSGGTPTSSIKSYYNGDIPFLAISDMTEQGKFLVNASKKISHKGIENSATWIVPIGSIIYSMYASVGFVSIAKIELAISQAVLCIVFKEGFSHEYMYYHLNHMQEEVLKYVGEGTQKNLSAKTVRDFNFSIPNSKEQTRIARILSDMDTELEQLETELAKLKQLKAGMMQELLTGKKRLANDLSNVNL